MASSTSGARTPREMICRSTMSRRNTAKTVILHPSVATKAIEYAICFKHNMISVNIREIWDPELPETGLV
jgi:hypothetical protein